MTDTFSVTITLDKPSYNKGDLIRATLSGSDVLTTTQTTTVSLSGTAVAADGATSTVPPFSFQLNTPVTTQESVKIQSITDPSGRVWTVDPGGAFATAIA